MIGAGRLERLRYIAERDLPDTCEIHDTIRVSDGMGGETEKRVLVATVPCRYAPLSAYRAGGIVGDQVREDATGVLTFPAGTAIRPEHTVTLGSRTFHPAGQTGERSVEITRRVPVLEVS